MPCTDPILNKRETSGFVDLCDRTVAKEDCAAPRHGKLNPLGFWHFLVYFPRPRWKMHVTCNHS